MKLREMRNMGAMSFDGFNGKNDFISSGVKSCCLGCLGCFCDLQVLGEDKKGVSQWVN